MNYELGTLTYSSTALTYDFSGNVFRLVPHGSSEPFSTTHSLGGGRWNAPNTFPVTYTFTDTVTAQQYMTVQEIQGGFSWLEVQPERQPDLLVMNWEITGLVDMATNEGLAVYNLPATYPSGFEFVSSWAVTQPIGTSMFETGAVGLVARSASATDFSRPVINWAEIAVFSERVSLPNLIDRIPFDDWYGP